MHDKILTSHPVVHCMSLLYCCLFLLKIPLHFEHSPIFYTFLSTSNRRGAGTRSWAKWWSWLRSGLGLPRNSGGRELLSTVLWSRGTGKSLSLCQNLHNFIIHFYFKCFSLFYSSKPLKMITWGNFHYFLKELERRIENYWESWYQVKKEQYFDHCFCLNQSNG